MKRTNGGKLGSFSIQKNRLFESPALLFVAAISSEWPSLHVICRLPTITMARVLLFALFQVCLQVTLDLVRSQSELGNWRCIVGHNYSTNWNEFSDAAKEQEPLWWYYAYKVDESSPLREVSCGPGFDACRTEILVHEKKAFDSAQQQYVPFKYAEMVLSCSYVDYCYESDNSYMYSDPNTLVYHNDAEVSDYAHKIHRIVQCCNDEWNCNIDEEGEYANKYAAGSASGVSLAAVFTSLVLVKIMY